MHYLWSADLSKSFSQLIVPIVTSLNQYPFSELAWALCFPADIFNRWQPRPHSEKMRWERGCIDGASWTLDPTKEAMNCKVKHTNSKSDV